MFTLLVGFSWDICVNITICSRFANADYAVDAVVMYRAQFAFSSRETGVLSCVVGDQFTVLDSTNEQWWLVQNGKGQIGYVPANYIVPDDVRMINEMSLLFVRLVLYISPLAILRNARNVTLLMQVHCSPY